MDFEPRFLMLWLVIGAFIILLFNLFTVPTHAPEEEIVLSDFMGRLDRKEVKKVIVKGDSVSAILQDETHVRTYTGRFPELIKKLLDSGVQLEVIPTSSFCAN